MQAHVCRPITIHFFWVINKHSHKSSKVNPTRILDKPFLNIKHCYADPKSDLRRVWIRGKLPHFFTHSSNTCISDRKGTLEERIATFEEEDEHTLNIFPKEDIFRSYWNFHYNFFGGCLRPCQLEETERRSWREYVKLGLLKDLEIIFK